MTNHWYVCLELDTENDNIPFQFEVQVREAEEALDDAIETMRQCHPHIKIEGAKVYKLPEETINVKL